MYQDHCLIVDLDSARSKRQTGYAERTPRDELNRVLVDTKRMSQEVSARRVIYLVPSRRPSSFSSKIEAVGRVGALVDGLRFGVEVVCLAFLLCLATLLLTGCASWR